MRILVIEDERALCETIVRSLKRLAYSVDFCYDGNKANELLGIEKYDLVLLDLNLPGADGMTVLRTLRQTDRDTGVLILSARCEVADKVEGLDAGADDYLIKPFAFEELLARLRVLLRKPVTEKSNVLKVADLSLYIDTRRVFRGENEIQLSSKEYALLYYMMQNAGMVLDRDKLEQHVWDYDFSGGSNVIDVYIRYLRKKVDEGYSKKLIHTVRGHGYILKDAEP